MYNPLPDNEHEESIDPGASTSLPNATQTSDPNQPETPSIASSEETNTTQSNGNNNNNPANDIERRRANIRNQNNEILTQIEVLDAQLVNSLYKFYYYYMYCLMGISLIIIPGFLFSFHLTPFLKVSLTIFGAYSMIEAYNSRKSEKTIYALMTFSVITLAHFLKNLIYYINFANIIKQKEEAENVAIDISPGTFLFLDVFFPLLFDIFVIIWGAWKVRCLLKQRESLFEQILPDIQVV